MLFPNANALFCWLFGEVLNSFHRVLHSLSEIRVIKCQKSCLETTLFFGAFCPIYGLFETCQKKAFVQDDKSFCKIKKARSNRLEKGGLTARSPIFSSFPSLPVLKIP